MIRASKSDAMKAAQEGIAEVRFTFAPLQLLLAFVGALGVVGAVLFVIVLRQQNNDADGPFIRLSE